MKSASLILIIWGFLHFAQSLESKIDDKGCEFSENNSVVNCNQLCESDKDCITTELPEEDRKEVVEENIAPTIGFASFSLNLNHVCRKG